MINLWKQNHFRPLQKLPFCYLCGREFSADDKVNADHVPPQTIFEKHHREPIKLPTHCDCNHAHHQNDEMVGQLIAMSRWPYIPSEKKSKLKFVTFPEEKISAFTNLDIEGAVFRWVMGFHSSLYREPISREVRAAIFSPFVTGQRWGGGTPLFMPTTLEYHGIVETVRAHRENGNVDKISCNRGQVLYECVWIQIRTGEWACCFMLDVCAWKGLGETPQWGARDCAGLYPLPLSLRPPVTACTGESLFFTDYNIVRGT